ncbi:MAG: lactaldehyde reductase [Epulopiscium sp.]|jgi:lactaldehyde reductase|uniref:Lactaldehyde reductase n=1 Tax=Defluviitalea raffinosedens TaxID=1450156 RepID=A0A7C8LIT0_9FIRM|nr:lactaldehyde reductase [Defluviitalea raffinosedens]MBZ4669624.1 lactaldehyde reductase [Defluviitaleaceae bacterium]MDK2787740.1 lactaldehyde reductase [Candidatus Epulonipiscium sp.]KAE9636038.1 lactaldehyde reductase [Defluviitalea raffinosedens]MBM7685119.1 lactaldehyde reductase [Defluviitalea raffinosedens]HHW67409.1 lactaldehyde reductase [Candidatus Epulonipiscium sp.]
MVKRVVLNETSYFGQGAIQVLPQEIKDRGFKKAFIVTDKELLKFNVTQKVTKILEDANIPYVIYDNVNPNPTIENVVTGVKAYKDSGADFILAVGGGSPIDAAKGIGVVVNNPEFADVKSLEGVAPTKNKPVPMIVVPTTAGTASEVTTYYVITDEEAVKKMVCVDTKTIPVLAVVDPDMMVSMPKGLTAATGMDALTHAIESYITKGAWGMTDMFALEAIKLIANNLSKAVFEPNNIEARDAMATAQYIAGMAFSNAGLGLVHAMAHQLGAVYDTPHGVANALLLPYVMEYNAPATGDKYREIARQMGVPNVDSMSVEEFRQAAIDAVKNLSKEIGIPQKLVEIGAKEEDLPTLAKKAYGDTCTPGNPRDTSVEDILEVYKKAFK